MTGNCISGSYATPAALRRNTAFFSLANCNTKTAEARVDYSFPSVRTHRPSYKHLPKCYKQSVIPECLSILPSFSLHFPCPQHSSAKNLCTSKSKGPPPSQLVTVTTTGAGQVPVRRSTCCWRGHPCHRSVVLPSVLREKD